MLKVMLHSKCSTIRITYILMIVRASFGVVGAPPQYMVVTEWTLPYDLLLVQCEISQHLSASHSVAFQSILDWG